MKFNLLSVRKKKGLVNVEEGLATDHYSLNESSGINNDYNQCLGGDRYNNDDDGDDDGNSDFNNVRYNHEGNETYENGRTGGASNDVFHMDGNDEQQIGRYEKNTTVLPLHMRENQKKLHSKSKKKPISSSYCPPCLLCFLLLVFTLGSIAVVILHTIGHRTSHQYQLKHQEFVDQIKSRIVTWEQSRIEEIKKLRSQFASIKDELNKPHANSNFVYSIPSILSYPKKTQRKEPEKEHAITYKPPVIHFQDVLSKFENSVAKKSKHNGNLNHEENICPESEPCLMVVGKNIYKYDVLKKIISTHYRLIIGVPTLPRSKGNVPLDYLSQSVNSLLKEYESFRKNSMDKEKILIFVQNNSFNNAHIVFQKLKTQFRHNVHVLFYDNPVIFHDPIIDNPIFNYAKPDNMRASPKARQQNCDVASMTAHVLRNFNFDYLMYTEDDFLACNGFYNGVFSALNGMETTNQEVCGLRVSYGMSGVAMPKKVLHNFLDYIEKNIDYYPIDLLSREFQFSGAQNPNFCKVNRRKSFTYKSVLLEHIGDVSTFDERNKASFRPKFPKCNTSMHGVWNLSSEERFNPICNGKSLISPC